ncbi:hypothetical protein ACNKHV_07680 [Shigella flexneri]
MSIFSDYSSSSEMHNNLTIDYYLALSSTKGSGITNIISIILQQAHDDDVAKEHDGEEKQLRKSL